MPAPPTPTLCFTKAAFGKQLTVKGEEEGLDDNDRRATGVGGLPT
jgi:hypothetical protein